MEGSMEGRKGLCETKSGRWAGRREFLPSLCARGLFVQLQRGQIPYPKQRKNEEWKMEGIHSKNASSTKC